MSRPIIIIQAVGLIVLAALMVIVSLENIALKETVRTTNRILNESEAARAAQQADIERICGTQPQLPYYCQ